MFGIDLNKAIFRTATRLICFLPGIQKTNREKLVEELQAICSKCEDAYTAVRKRLKPVKVAYRDPAKLVTELRGFSADSETRAAFKPEHLCGEIDHLLQELRSNLEGLQYSVRWSGLGTLIDTLHQLRNYDSELRLQYEQFCSELDEIASKIEKAKKKTEREQWRNYIEDLVASTEEELQQSIAEIRKAKDKIMSAAF